MRPVLFLDVDGVLNVYGLDGSLKVNTKRVGLVEIPQGTQARLQVLLQRFDPYWATAWRGEAHPQLAAALGIPETPVWPHIAYDDFKYPKILTAAGTRPWAWLDDKAEWELDRLGAYPPANGFVVSPIPVEGITDRVVTMLLDFAGRC